MGSQTSKCREVALVESQWSSLGCEPDEVHGPLELPRLGVHGPGLEDVQRLGHGGGYGPCSQAAGEVEGKVVGEVGGGQQGLLHLGDAVMWLKCFIWANKCIKRVC